MNSFYVKSCADCPFQNTDAEYCNAADEDVAVWFHAAQDTVPENCPLRLGPVVVSLIKAGNCLNLVDQ